MSLGKHAVWSVFFGVWLVLAGCTGGGSSSSNTIATAIQDLTTDPDGLTTVITFDSAGGLAAATAANFEADGGQTAQSVTVNDDEVTVTWDERVTPSHEVRVVDLSGVASAFHAVTTSDTSVPAFTITDGTQNAGLGGDTIEVTFSGPRVVESLAEDATHWILTVGGQARDLTGSVLVLDTANQVLAITLGADANLHATFTLAASGVQSVADVNLATSAVNGAATGDATAPTLLSAEQNLGEDEFGRVIDFTFDEAMDPLLSLSLARYSLVAPDVATSVEQVSEDVLRVTFSAPVIPGVDEVTLNGLVDLHGNSFPTAAQAITQPSPVVNAYDGAPDGVTVQGVLGDYITVVTTQAFDPDDAIDPSKWDLVVDGNTITMADQTLEYDLLTKTLTITLDFDMQNGDAFTVTGGNVLEVDGQTFALVQGGAVAGDATAPTVASATQNRSADGEGTTVDVVFSEALDQATAENLANYTISGAQSLVSATLLTSPDQVRLVFDDAVIPGDFTLTVDAVEDLAGNDMSAQAGIAVATDDALDPDVSTAAAEAVEGANDDTLAVVFDDDMIESEVETASSWSVESPIGVPVSTVGATVSYDDVTRTATLTFANGVNLQRGDDFQVAFTTMRDLGGNVVLPTELTGDVAYEVTLPEVHTVYRESSNFSQVVVRFTEPCGQLTDLYNSITNPDGTRYDLRDLNGVHRAFATSAATLDEGLGVRVSFGVVVAATDTIDVLGVLDLAGNPLFPALAVATVAEDTAVPALDVGLSVVTSVTGENNDTVEVKFDRPMSPWKLLDPANYTLTRGFPLDLSTATLTFDGVDTVTIHLGVDDEHDVATAAAYTVTANDVWSAQGTQRTVADSDVIAAVGDSLAASVPALGVRIDPTTTDALVIECDEAVAATATATATNYDYDGGNFGVAAERMGFRNVRVTFGVTPVIGQSVDFVLTDLAGNGSATITRVVTAADSDYPLIASVAGIIQPGYAGDCIEVVFDEPVSPATALNRNNYVVQSGSTTLNLANATLGYESASNTVYLRLPDGQNLDSALALTVTIDNVEDFSGNAMPAAIPVGGPVSGDSTAPSFSKAFVNYRADATGKVIDVLFSEDVSTSFVTNASHWTASGGPVVLSVVSLERNHARVTLSAALGAAATLSVTGLPDFASNVSGAIAVDPHE